MPLTPAQRIGPYDVVSAIGAGGMGEVYRAKDTRLNRDVAIKILPELFADDPERLARFTREAQVLAALNHPNIAHIHGLEESGGIRALVMELVEGEDLSAIIARGPLPLPDALAIARQIADALEAAHGQGVIHRDLKPANVKVRTDGTVKVLDFGLAKAVDPAGVSGAGVANSPTLTSPAMTQLGVMLGTAAYVAPEQAKGKAVDKRADIWAFGCVLYEMLTGVSPFAGDSIGDVIAAVLTRDIDLGALAAGTPPSVRRLLDRCLQRDPRRRLRDIGDAMLEIDAAAEQSAPLAAAAAGGRFERLRLFAVVAAAVVLTAAATTVIVSWRRAALPSPVRAAVIPESGFLDFSTVAVSPSGSELAFYRDRAVGGGDLFVRRLNDFSERVLQEQLISLYPFFSPKGDELAFSSNERRAVFRVPLSGGTPIEVVRAADAMPGLWLDDGSMILTSALVDGKFERGLSQVPSSGPAARLTTLGATDVMHMQPAALPGGRLIVFTVVGPGGSHLAVVDLQTKEQRLLQLPTGASTPHYLPSGHLVYFEPALQQIRAVAFDAVRAEPVGEPVVVLTNVQRAGGGIGSFIVSRDGHLYYTAEEAREPDRPFRLAWSGPGGPALTDERASWAQPRLSPDGRRLIVRQTATPNCTLWLYDLDRGSRTRILATDPHDPMWHPDGQQLIFSALTADGHQKLFTKKVDGTDPARSIATGYPETEQPRSISADGKWLAVSRSTPKTDGDLWIVPLEGGEPRLFAGSDFAEDHAAFSPDGRWIAYTSNQSGREEVYVRPWPAADEQYQVSAHGGTGAIWSRDSRRLIYSDGRRIVSVDVTTEDGGTRRFRAGNPQPFVEGRVLLQRVGNYDLAPDGRRMVFVEGDSRDAKLGRDLRVIFNWVEDLKRKVPTR